MRIIDIIDQNISAGSCQFTFEVLPPLKGEGTSRIFSAIDTLAPLGPAYINVTNQREAIKTEFDAEGNPRRRVYRHRPGTVGISAAIAKRYKIEVVPHIICGGNSRYQIEDLLIDLDFLGMHNVLALRGDGMKDERGFIPHPEGYAHADELVEQIVAMNGGRFIDNEVEDCHRSKFCIGVAGYPEKHKESPDMESDIARLKAKVDAGGEYVVTQMFYDNAKFFDFVRRCREAGIKVPIIPGIKPLSTIAQLDVLPKVFSIEIPEELERAARKCKDSDAVKHVGIEWATMQAVELKRAGLPIIHFYTMGRTENVARIVKNVF